MAIKIQIASDLHLEFLENRDWLEKNPLIQKGDVLILAGDTIWNARKEKAKKFYKYIESKFKNIIQIQGNHEFYKGEVYFAYPSYSKKISKNHTILNNKSIIIDKIKFICSALWSHIPPSSADFIQQGMNDYRLIYFKVDSDKFVIDPTITNRFNETSVNFIKRELAKPFDGKIVVVTHHLPSYKCIDKNFKDSRFNPGYANHLDQLIKENPQIKLWIHGHSHHFSDIKIGHTRIVRNPLGYVFDMEQKDFKRDLVIKV